MIKVTVSNDEDEDFSLVDPNDNVEETKRKLQHSDSLYLLRKKVQHDETDKNFSSFDDTEESSA